jgi:diaminohydroxyphosphoribosylaminopyrimidine deaminase/5-amino-6-(5-phosphoribosylamino)uracil reductase
MPTTFSPDDHRFMRLALSLAARARGRVEPNPVVGAVVVKNGKIVGKGYHQRFGGPHAEVFALTDAGTRARDATLYVTLEPCCHWGKTPPCTDAVLAAGIRRVVIALIDPFSKVRGKGASILRRAGLQVDVGLLEGEARALNAAFITRLTENRPFIIAKWAQSLDGAIATAAGESRWISSKDSRAFVHQLRARVDGILVGVGTALADDPLLTARVPPAQVRRLATRIVLDSHCRLPVDSELVRTVADAPLLVAHLARLPPAAEKRRAALAARGAMTVAIARDKEGRPSLPAFLRHLAALDYTHLLVEGGGELLASLFAGDLVDEAHVFLAPILIPGKHARRPVGGADLKKLAAAPRLEIVDTTRRGPDLHLTLRRRSQG